MIGKHQRLKETEEGAGRSAKGVVAVEENVAKQGEIDALVEERIQAVAAQRKRRRRMFWLAFVGIEIYIGVSYLASQWLIFHSNAVYHRLSTMFGLMETLPVFAFLALVYYLNVKPTQSERWLLRELADCDDLRAIGPLLEALSLDDRRVRAAITPALARLLARVRPEDSAVISERTYRGLYGVLRWIGAPLVGSYVTPDLAVAALQALGRIGDERALPNVRRVADLPMRSEAEERIHRAAVTAIAEPERRLGRDGQGESLLRAAEPAPESLLRAATRAPDAPAETLVRPSTAPEDDG